MVVNRIFTTASRQISSGLATLTAARQRHRKTSSSTTESDGPTPEEQAATERRQHERAQCADDGAYFEFLIERAVADGKTTSTGAV